MQYNQNLSVSDQLGNKLVKHVLCGIAIIGGAAFLCAFTQMIETILIIEIATTSSALLVSTICLVHLYKEHRMWQKQEEQLIHVLIKQIQQHFSQLPPLSIIEEALHQALDAKEGELRLKMLGQYRLQPALLDSLVQYCRQRHADHAVLVDLGLCWD
jgi:hypothetical protein